MFLCAVGLMTALGLGFVVPRHAVGKPSAMSHATVDARVQSANFTRGAAIVYQRSVSVVSIRVSCV